MADDIPGIDDLLAKQGLARCSLLGHLVGEPGAGSEQCRQGTGRDQRLGAAEIGNHRLAHGATTLVLDDLEVGTLA